MVEVEKWLRPDARRLLRLLAFLVGGLWLFLSTFTAYAAMWWPAHGILDTTVVGWFGGMAVLSLIFAGPFALSWLWDRRMAWRICPEGIAVYCVGELRRSFAWSEVVSLRVLPYGVVVRLVSRPFEERLQWPGVGEASWLREFARERLGDRVHA